MSELDPSARSNSELETSEVESDELDIDTVTQYYAAGAGKEDFRSIGIDPDAVTSYIKGLPDEQREYYQDQRREANFVKDARATLMETQPELFDGKVPADAEEKIRQAGYEGYAVGFTQIDAIADVEQATQYLDEHSGVAMAGYGLHQRFLVHDSSQPMEDYPLGYYTPRAGRFVYAFPVSTTETNSPRDAAIVGEAIPDDMYVTGEDGNEYVNAKYCVGFIDGNQIFHQNPGFMETQRDKDGLDAYERGVREKVRSIHAEAEASGRELTDAEVMSIRGLSLAVKARRERGSHDEQLKTFMEDEAIDPETARLRYETQVQEFVRGLHKKAADEGRELTDGEKQQISNAAQTVQDLRRTLARVA